MRKFFIAAAIAVVALLGASNSADAAFRLRVDTNGGTLGAVITDQSAGDHTVVNDLNTMTTYNSGTVLNAIAFSGSLGSFNLSVTTGTSTPFLGAPSFYEAIDLNNVTLTATGAGTLRLILAQSGFGANTPDGLLSFNSKVGGVLMGSVGSSITFESYADNTGAIPDLGLDNWDPMAGMGGAYTQPPGTVSGIGAGSPAYIKQEFGNGSFGDTSGVSFNAPGDYSVYTVVTVTFTSGGGSVSFNQLVGTSPAPAGLVLALAGMPLFGLGAYLRRRRAAQM